MFRGLPQHSRKHEEPVAIAPSLDVSTTKCMASHSFALIADIRGQGVVNPWHDHRYVCR